MKTSKSLGTTQLRLNCQTPNAIPLIETNEGVSAYVASSSPAVPPIPV